MPEQLSANFAVWAKRIAQEVEPEQEDLAPTMMAAYLRGGRDRKQLFESKSELGGFLPDGGLSLLPFAYLAVMKLAELIVSFYQADGLRVITDVLKAWKSWLEVAKERASATSHTATPTDVAEPLPSLRRVLDEIQETLHAQGLPREQCELITYRVMKALLKEPAEAAQLLTAFGKGQA